MTGPAGTDSCAECANPLRFAAGEYFHDGRNHWSVEFTCRACGSGGVTCGKDLPDDHVRSLLIEQTGLWALTLRDTAAPGTGTGTAILRALRRAHGNPLSDAKDQAGRLRRDGLTGTRGEMLRLAHILEQLGVLTDVTLRTAERAPAEP